MHQWYTCSFHLVWMSSPPGRYYSLSKRSRSLFETGTRTCLADHSNIPGQRDIDPRSYIIRYWFKLCRFIDFEGISVGVWFSITLLDWGIARNTSRVKWLGIAKRTTIRPVRKEAAFFFKVQARRRLTFIVLRSIDWDGVTPSNCFMLFWHIWVKSR